ncbi:hypothetical protein [Amycolatopsis saalfeldensis]|uniref:hypothetical protein n=1 Tax=Amycolatopsis saalfeldensis TaxID=394193 RepID=UPI000B88BFC9|nr:hypothetical protein [Amycolatopsis saalfeldensis]
MGIAPHVVLGAALADLRKLLVATGNPIGRDRRPAALPGGRELLPGLGDPLEPALHRVGVEVHAFAAGGRHDTVQFEVQEVAAAADGGVDEAALTASGQRRPPP